MRSGGVLADIFGNNGRFVIDGLIEAQSRTTVPDLMFGRVRRKLGLL